jgi:uncharacterized repeat protein (TIGR03803 family)
LDTQDGAMKTESMTKIMEICTVQDTSAFRKTKALSQILAGLMSLSSGLHAQTFTLLHTFSWSDGANPQGPLVATGNVLFGTTVSGGTSPPWGTVFSINTDGSGFASLHSFTGKSDGGEPASGVVMSGGTLYGTAPTGGTLSNGVIFSMNTDGSGFAPLYTFTGGSDGRSPYGGLVAADRLYGVTEGGGDGEKGTVFALDTSGNYTLLHAFAASDLEGDTPTSGLILSGNTLYGTAEFGGPNGSGTVFSVTTNATPFASFNVLYSFTRHVPGLASTNSDGAYPASSPLVLSGNTLYGTTVSGGPSGFGTIFSLNTGGNGFQVIHSFTTANPNSALTLFNNRLYGTTQAEGTGQGSLFSLNTDGSDFTVLCSLTGGDGSGPSFVAPLLIGSTLYATASDGGSSGDGTVFALNLSNPLIFPELYSFPSSGTNGANPQTGLVQGADGNFYGTTAHGAGNNDGTIFKITTNGTLTVLASINGPSGDFNNAPGAFPNSALVQGLDGNFYGTTYNGGIINSWGTVFKVTPNGTLTILASFNGTNGVNPSAALVQGADGNFYGTTYNGGTGIEVGTVFRITTNGTVTSLVSFNGINGANPCAALVQGSDGNFYGTTHNGGTNNSWGTVFEITTNGTLTSLASFNGTNGANPSAALLQGVDGNFYGTTYNGGTGSEVGTVFKITTNGTVTSLVSFNGINGANPSSALVQGTDGNFYGTTAGGGAYNDGIVFTMPPLGVLTTLLSFNGANGEAPLSSVVQGTNGNFYGVTSAGGEAGNGTFFSFSPPPVFQTLIRHGQTLTLAWSAVAGQIYQLQYTTNLALTNWNTFGYPLVATNGTSSISDTIGPDPQRFYRVVQSP